MKTIKNFFYKISLRNQIIIFTVLIVLVSMIFSAVYFYYTVASIIENNEFRNLNQLMVQTNNNIETALDTINNTSQHFFSNNTIMNLLSEGIPTAQDSLDMFKLKSSIESEMKYSMMFNNAWDQKLIYTAFMFFNEQQYCSVSRFYSYNAQSVEKNKEIYRTAEGTFYPGLKLIPPSKDDSMIYFVRNIYAMNHSDNKMYLIVGTPEDVFSAKYQEFLKYPGSKFYLVNQKGIIFATPDKNELGTQLSQDILNITLNDTTTEKVLNGKEYIVTSKHLLNSELISIAAIPKQQVMLSFSDSIKNYLIITIIIVIIFLLLSFIISFGFTGFLKDFVKGIKEVQAGNYKVKMPQYNNTELDNISRTFNNMTSQIDYLINDVYEKQLLIKEMDINFLQSQMNPHFLFNVLLTISTKAKLSKDETIFKMVQALTTLLQASLYKKSNIKIPIKEEIEYVKFYLYLQKIRFGSRLDYKINIDDDCILYFYIPRLTIQPLVENAVVHGIESKLSGGFITVNLSRKEGDIYIEVIDNGAGFNIESLNLNDLNNADSRRDGSHNSIGLVNTIQRIKLIYGDKYGVDINTGAGSGTTITVHIPEDRGENC